MQHEKEELRAQVQKSEEEIERRDETIADQRDRISRLQIQVDTTTSFALPLQPPVTSNSTCTSRSPSFASPSFASLMLVLASHPRQVGASSASGGAKAFLDELIGVKEKYAVEAQRAKQEAEAAKRNVEVVTRENEEKERLIR
eukprot:768217-Hanusia_phi.AAC.3